MGDTDDDPPKTEISVTLREDLRDEAYEIFGGRSQSEAVRQAVRVGVECSKTDHNRTVERLVRMLEVEWGENRE